MRHKGIGATVRCSLQADVCNTEMRTILLFRVNAGRFQYGAWDYSLSTTDLGGSKIVATSTQWYVVIGVGTPEARQPCKPQLPPV